MDLLRSSICIYNFSVCLSFIGSSTFGPYELEFGTLPLLVHANVLGHPPAGWPRSSNGSRVIIGWKLPGNLNLCFYGQSEDIGSRVGVRARESMRYISNKSVSESHNCDFRISRRHLLSILFPISLGDVWF